MSKHYQDIVDEIFGRNFQHRTLRTIFDPFSSEWEQTSIERKIEILRIILNSEKISLSTLVSSYKYYYSTEIKNKKHVLDSLEDSLIILNQNLLCQK